MLHPLSNREEHAEGEDDPQHCHGEHYLKTVHSLLLLSPRGTGREIAGEISVRLEFTSNTLRRKFGRRPNFDGPYEEESRVPMRCGPHARSFRVGLTPHEQQEPARYA